MMTQIAVNGDTMLVQLNLRDLERVVKGAVESVLKEERIYREHKAEAVRGLAGVEKDKDKFCYSDKEIAKWLKKSVAYANKLKNADYMQEAVTWLSPRSMILDKEKALKCIKRHNAEQARNKQRITRKVKR